MRKLTAYIMCFACILLLFAGCTKPSIENPDNTTPSSQSSQPATENSGTRPAPIFSTTSPTKQTDAPFRSLPEGEPLTVEKFAWFQEEFYSGVWVDKDEEWYFNIRNMLLQIEFKTREEIDMSLLFRNGVYPTKEAVTQKEIDALQQATGNAVPGEVIKIPKGDMELAFTHTTGKSFESTKKNGLDKLVYLEEYDAYYSFLAPIESPRYEIKEGVKLHGGATIVLRYANKQNPSAGDWIVTLRSHDGTYWPVSNLPCSG